MAEPVLVGQKTQSGDIYLKAVLPPTWWQKLVKWLGVWLVRALWAVMTFLAGWIAGNIWG